MLFLQSLTPEQEANLEKAAEQAKEQFSSWWHLLLSDPEAALKDLGGWALHYAVIFIVAIAAFMIGRWLIGKLLKMLQRLFEKREVDPSVVTFALSLARVLLYIMLLVIVVTILGGKASSFVTIIAAAGFAVGMALSGTLQNFAGGVMILLLKPYHVGDYVTAQGQEGTVKSIQLFNTILTTPDNKTIILPNGPVSTGIIVNTSTQSTRRAEWIIGVNYGDDFALCQSVIRDILDKDPRILRNPDYTIEIKELAESSVNIVVRAWTKSSNYWDVFFEINSRIYKILPEKGLQFPFPQMDIHITK